ncbi:MAG: sulfite exporter TauE/SafE family protein [Proteobacteria bacterium]|nr:sulfite exporter TauE/SafE family protein [Pseudomonadota bacterium]
MNDFDIATLALLALGLVAGGVTKGFAGSGLPTVSVASMAIVIDVPTAVALMPIPLLVANARQAFRGGYMRNAMRCFWPLLVCLPFGAVLGVKVLTGIDARTVSGLVGAIVVAFALLSQVRFEWRVSARRERQLQPLVGLGAGVIGGISSIFAPLIVMHLMSLRLPKDEFVGTVGLAYLVGIVPMILALTAFGRLGQTETLWGAAALVPVLAGMFLGERLRGHFSETLFRRCLLVLLLLAGLNLIVQAFA